jgi:lambda family phage portal protein
MKFSFLRRKKEKKRVVRSFYGGSNSSRFLTDLMGSFGSADVVTADGLAKLRARARELAENNPIAKRYINLMCTNVIGEKGIVLQAKTRNQLGTLDTADNQMIERHWNIWCQRYASKDRRRNLVEVQQLVEKTLSRDGEVLIRILNDENPYGISLQVLESDYLNETYNKDLGVNKIKMGIEVNGFNRPVAYHLFRKLPNDTLSGGLGSTAQSDYIRVPADNIIYLTKSDRPSATRGVTPFAPVMESLNMLHGYDQAELFAARASSIMFTTTTSELPEYDQALATSGTEDTADCSGMNYVSSIQPGDNINLPPGVKMNLNKAEHPTTAYGEFTKNALRRVAIGLNVNYNSLAGDYESVNYSSARVAILEDRPFFKIEQQFIINNMLRKVYEDWLLKALLLSAIKNNQGKPIPYKDEILEKFSQVEFKPKGWGWVDPIKEVEASVAAIQNGLRSPQDVISESGRDAEEVLTEIQNYKSLAKEKGLELAIEPLGSFKKIDFNNISRNQDAEK